LKEKVLIASKKKKFRQYSLSKTELLWLQYQLLQQQYEWLQQ